MSFNSTHKADEFSVDAFGKKIEGKYNTPEAKGTMRMNLAEDVYKYVFSGGKVVGILRREFMDIDIHDVDTDNKLKNKFIKGIVDTIAGDLQPSYQSSARYSGFVNNVAEIRAENMQGLQAVAYDHATGGVDAYKKSPEYQARQSDLSNQTNVSYGIRLPAELKVDRDIDSKKMTLIRGAIIGYIKSNEHNSQSRKWMDNNGHYDPEKHSGGKKAHEVSVAKYKKNLDQMRNLSSGQHPGIVDIDRPLERAVKSQKSTETTKKWVGGTSSLVGNIVGAYGVTSLAGMTNVYKGGAEKISQGVGSVKDAALGVLGMEDGSVDAMLSYTDEAIANLYVDGVDGLKITGIALAGAGILKYMSKRLKDRRATLTYDEKKKINVMINKWTVIFTTVSATPFMAMAPEMYTSSLEYISQVRASIGK